jgi:hypothetical protein
MGYADEIVYVYIPLLERLPEYVIAASSGCGGGVSGGITGYWRLCRLFESVRELWTAHFNGLVHQIGDSFRGRGKQRGGGGSIPSARPEGTRPEVLLPTWLEAGLPVLLRLPSALGSDRNHQQCRLWIDTPDPGSGSLSQWRSRFSTMLVRIAWIRPEPSPRCPR